MTHTYPNPKVDELIYEEIAKLDFQPEDFVALAIACLDQAGVSAAMQENILEIVLACTSVNPMKVRT